MSKLNLIAEPGSHAIVMTREFAAPRDLVFRTFTDPALVPRWWGCEPLHDHRRPDGGADGRPLALRLSTDAEGEFAFRGVYHEIRAAERLVYTFEFEGMPGHILLETVTFEERDGRTTGDRHGGVPVRGGPGRHAPDGHGRGRGRDLGPLRGTAEDAVSLTHLTP